MIYGGFVSLFGARKSFPETLLASIVLLVNAASNAIIIIFVKAYETNAILDIKID